MPKKYLLIVFVTWSPSSISKTAHLPATCVLVSPIEPADAISMTKNGLEQNTAPIAGNQADGKITPNKQQGQPIKRTITICNGITKKMISYNKSFLSYTPHFQLRVNDIALKPGEQKSIDVEDDKLKVTYTYNFLNGYKKGTKEITFKLQPAQKDLNVKFSWQNDWRVIIGRATPIEKKELTN